MPKTEVDWTPLDNYQAQPAVSPRLTFDTAIQAEISRMLAVIKYVTVTNGQSEYRLTSYASNSNPEDYFVRAHAMRELLTACGSLAAFYGESPEYKVSTVNEDCEVLYFPSATYPGMFKVVMRESSEPSASRQTFYYLNRKN